MLFARLSVSGRRRSRKQTVQIMLQQLADPFEGDVCRWIGVPSVQGLRAMPLLREGGLLVWLQDAIVLYCLRQAVDQPT